MMVKRNNKISIGLIFSKLILCISFLVVGCSQNEKPKQNAPIQNKILPAKDTRLSNLSPVNQPSIILLKNSPRPVTTVVPPGYTYSNIPHALPSAINSQAISNQTMPTGLVAQGKGFFTTYTTDDGLALDQVLCSFKDKRGNLWFGTNGGGVSKYDGRTFTNYNAAQGLANNIVWCIAEDNQGSLWFGTDGGGASKYDGERFTNFTTAQGLSANAIFSIINDKDNNMWFGTAKGGVSKLHDNTFVHYTTKNSLAGDTVKCMIEDKKGNVWVGTLGGGVSKFDGINFTNYSTVNGLAGNNVWSIAEDKNGNIWIGTEKGASRFDGTKFTNYTKAQGLPENFIVSILHDAKGGLWFGTLKSGVSFFDGNNFINYAEPQGLCNNSVRSMVEDEQGNLWFTTYGGGLSKFAGNGFINFTIEQGISNNVVFSITEDKGGNLWFGTSGGGVSRYDGKKFTTYSKSQGMPDNVIYSIANDRNGNFWFGTSGNGVIKFDGKKFTQFTTKQGLANNIIFSILEDKKGYLWFGTSGGGVSKFDGKSFTNYTTVQGLANNVVFSMTEDNESNLWLGTLGGGVSKFDGETFTNYTTDQGLADNVVWCITQDKTGNLLFGTQQGISVLDKHTKNVGKVNKNGAGKTDNTLFNTITEKDGLPDNFVTQIVVGNDSKLYIGTNEGICELIPINATNETQNTWQVGKIYNGRTGYPVKDVNAGLGAMYKDNKGIIWIGTGSDKTGLVRFDPGEMNTANTAPPPVYLKGIKINNENISWRTLDAKSINEKIDSNAISPIVTDEENTYGRLLSNPERDSLRAKFSKISFEKITKWNPIPEDLVLPYRFNNVDFEFNAIETGKNFLVQYQYMLQGYDREWSPPGYKTSVNYGHIFEGTYTFLLKAKSPEGVWSDPIAYTFKVLPPWWRTWWMYIFYSIMLITVLLSLFWWNNRQIIAKKNILEYKVKVATRQLQEENEKVNAQKKKIEETLLELKDTQSQLIQSEKMASLGELTAGIAHEIQNPLNFVNNFSEVSNELIDEMNDELDKGDIDEAKAISADIKQNLEKINQHGKRADAIVKGMLQHSRTSSGKKELTDINALCDEYLRLAYHGLRAKDKSFNATIKTDFDETVEKVNVIPQDIGRVVLNLLTNAFYAVDEKKKIPHPLKGDMEPFEPIVTITTKRLGTPSPDMQGQVGSRAVAIKVSDNGGGIPQKVLDKIFQPFFTTKPSGQGTGLGLSLSYDIVKAHGGELIVETKDGVGSTFIIQIPIIS